MRIALIQCSHEPDVLSAVLRAGMTPVECPANDTLLDMDGYILAGAGSADYSVLITAALQGKPVLGLGAGAGVLLETGLIPGLENNKPAVQLSSHLQTAAHLRVSDQYQRNAFTRHLTPTTVLPITSTDINLGFAMSPVLLQEIEEQGLNVFQYCNEAGVVVGDAPVNIAAMSNKAGNVMAVLPSLVCEAFSDAVFKSMHDYLKKGVFNQVAPLHYYPRRVPPQGS